MPASTPEELHELLAAAFTARDATAFAALHEPGAAVMLPPDGRRIEGREAVRAALEPMLARQPSLSIEVVGKLQTDELALTLGSWTLTAPDGDALTGRGTMVSRRQPDGTWLIVLDNPLSHASR